MDFDKVVRKRASIRSYSIKKVKVERVIEALQTANLAPSPGNLPIIYFLVVQDYETIKKIADACRQYFLEKAHYLVVVCSDPKRAQSQIQEQFPGLSLVHRQSPGLRVRVLHRVQGDHEN